MLAPLLTPVPAINIEFCSEQPPVKEPASPFDSISFGVEPQHNIYRPQHLLPPSLLSPKERTRPKQSQTSAGLDPIRFEALRNAAKGPTTPPKGDLRKEVALRVHQSKQLERRNLFLSKIEALPSATATSLPVTPPESPAVFHFTLPSPGLVSPLALFESLEGVLNPRPVRVDFRARARKEAEALAALTGNMKQSLQVHGLSTMAPHHSSSKEETKATQSLPSLDQISKRLGGNVTITRPIAIHSRLPAFLQRPGSSGRQSPEIVAEAEAATPKSNLAFLPSATHGPIARPKSSTGARSVRPPFSPASVTLAGPHIASTKAPMPLTAAALDALADRAERGSVMMERLKRRFSSPAKLGGQADGPTPRRIPGGF